MSDLRPLTNYAITHSLHKPYKMSTTLSMCHTLQFTTCACKCINLLTFMNNHQMTHQVTHESLGKVTAMSYVFFAPNCSVPF